jgi:phosphoribosylaminoimidazole-succinocarboxamide synthase
MAGLTESNVPGVSLHYRGKVRDVYAVDEYLLLVATDRISAFDVVIPTPIPNKGRILTALSNFWFGKTGGIIQNHLVDRPVGDFVKDLEALAQLDGRTVVCKKSEPLKVEAIVRGYLAGSGWVDYQKTGAVCGISLPAGLKESEKLPEPIFTPSTKAPKGTHDENISFERMVDIVGADLAGRVRTASLDVYGHAVQWAESRGIILADTKFEFGLIDGDLFLIDELMTPDSSRFWDGSIYEPGKSQPSFDKQFVRDWLKQSGWDRNPPAPELPPEIVDQTVEKYKQALVRLTGKGLDG